MTVYAKANGYRYLFFNCANAVGTAVFDVQAGTVTNGTATSVSITAVSGAAGWYKLVLTGNATVTGVPSLYWQIQSTYALGDQSFAGDGTSSIYLWGAQLEFGSISNTYIPTTTTAVYGTPTLSFSGVSTIGLESNGALFVQPAGTGALQAQATTSTTAGGNARGANAVDWQTSRDTAARVASGSTSFIGSGRNNTSSGQDNFVGAGFQNTASGGSQAAIVGGAGNQATAPLTFIGSGNGNQTTRDYSGIVAGHNNLATGYYNLIGGGFANSGTANAAVTTQATTAVTSGSTAVTLSGSNANIKVGQMCFGTGVTFPTTYVAAISGTSLTLSQNATTTGTPTLSFFTPHGVVVGGGNNQASGSYSFIGGGGDAGTAANRNVASGDWSVVAGGQKNTASGLKSCVSGGDINTASGQNSGIGSGNNISNTGANSFVGGGQNHTMSGSTSFIGGGYQHTNNSIYGFIGGGILGTTRGITGNHVFPACSFPISLSLGINQSALLILGRQTTDATPTALASDNSAASGTNQVILPNNSAYFFTGEVISGVTGGGDTKGWTIEGVIKRGANAASTALVGTPTVTSTYADAGASAWVIAVTADTTNGGIRVTFTGQAGTTIRTVCSIRTCEMTF
jgi:hypothetical protein